jgi:hypothetical protein
MQFESANPSVVRSIQGDVSVITAVIDLELVRAPASSHASDDVIALD